MLIERIAFSVDPPGPDHFLSGLTISKISSSKRGKMTTIKAQLLASVLVSKAGKSLRLPQPKAKLSLEENVPLSVSPVDIPKAEGIPH